MYLVLPEPNTSTSSAALERRHNITYKVLRWPPLLDGKMAVKFRIGETFNLLCRSQDGTETPQGVVVRPDVDLPEQLLDLADFLSLAAARKRVGALLLGLVLVVGEKQERRLADVLAECMNAEARHAAARGRGGGVALEVRLEISTDFVEERAACSACREEYAAGEATARGRFALCGHSFHAECFRYYTVECGVCPGSMCPMCFHGYK